MIFHLFSNPVLLHGFDATWDHSWKCQLTLWSSLFFLSSAMMLGMQGKNSTSFFRFYFCLFYLFFFWQLSNFTFDIKSLTWLIWNKKLLWHFLKEINDLFYIIKMDKNGDEEFHYKWNKMLPSFDREENIPFVLSTWMRKNITWHNPSIVLLLLFSTQILENFSY